MSNILTRIAFRKPLGSGTFGSVYMGKRKSDGLIVAVKLSKTTKKSFEIEMLDELRHPNIIVKLESKHYEYVEEEFGSKIYFDVIVMEYMPMNLQKYISEKLQNSATKLHDIRSIMYQVLNAVRFMHSKYIAHCDLKPQNILVANDASVVKICDLGQTCRIRALEAKPINVQTRGFVAPEILLDYPYYTKSIDLWSIGCILVTLNLNRELFGGKTDAAELITIYRLCGPFSLTVRNRMLEKMPGIQFGGSSVRFKRCLKRELGAKIADGDTVELIDRFLRMDPNKRLSACQALKLRFFKNFA